MIMVAITLKMLVAGFVGLVVLTIIVVSTMW